MTGQVRCLFVALGLVSALLPGCLSVFNPVKPPPKESKENCAQLPVTCRHKVYVVLVNGVDPLCCGNLQGVRDYLGSLGFIKTYLAQLYHEPCLLEELCNVHAEHPDARFAIIGFEYGASPARTLAEKATEKGLPVDLLVFLQPKSLGSDMGVVPSSVGRTITIQAGSGGLNNLKFADEEVVDVPCFCRYGVPTHTKTLSMLATELFHLAAIVPDYTPNFEPFRPILDDPAPPPRPIIASNENRGDEWDFLKLRNYRPRNESDEKPPAAPLSADQTSNR